MLTSKTKLASNIEFQFPSDRCCNCGAEESFKVLEQDTRVTRYMIGGGTELTFQLSLPFCADCELSVTRRPAGLGHRALVLLLSFAVSASAMIAISAIGEVAWLLDGGHLAASALVPAVAITALGYASKRPSGNQTSYYQPVRILKVKQEFVSGAVKGMHFGFTNATYARDFSAANADPIRSSQIAVKVI